MQQLKLALKLLRRDLRAGELSLLIFALLIAVGSTAAITLFSDRMTRSMSNQASEFLAADLAIAGANPIPPAWLDQAGTLGLKQAQVTEFNSMLLENNEMLLASVKAVSAYYPLRGSLKIAGADGLSQIKIQHGPEPGSVWVEQRVLTALGLELGASLTIGEQTLRISRILLYEPDKRSTFYNFAPRVLMHQQDLAATAVIQPGSHVQYVFQFSGEPLALSSFEDSLKTQLKPGQRLMDIHTDRPELGAALQRTSQYLGLSSVVVVLIAGVAIAMSAQRYSERHFNTAALWRCMGYPQNAMLRLFVYQFLLLGILCSVAGCGLGWLAQQGLFWVLADLLPAELAAPGLMAYVAGFITGMVILLGFALPPLLRLGRVPPLRVLRRELSPLPNSARLVYGLALSLMAALIWRYTADLKLTALILGSGALALLVLSGLIWVFLSLVSRLFLRMNLQWRFGLRGLLRNRQGSISQILAFGITLTALALSSVVRNDMLNNWLKQLPADAPNYFALNIFPEQVNQVQDYLQQAGINSNRFYPVVRGRLTAINTEPVQQRVVKDSQGEAATQRELSLTWSDSLPADNQVVAGGVWQADQPGQVSIEQKLAESLKILPGDRLSFSIGGSEVSAIVVNIRTVQWDTMRPNFYMIFSPGTLTDFPSTFITSFYVAEHLKPALNGLLKQFPATTLLELDMILAQFKTMLHQVTTAINLLLCFAVLAGLMVLFATVYASLDQRLYEAALLRTLGASRRFLRRAQLIEFLLLGSLAGLLAALASELIIYALYSQLLHMAYQPNFRLWASLPAIGAVLVSLPGLWGAREAVNQSPLAVLKRQ